MQLGIEVGGGSIQDSAEQGVSCVRLKNAGSDEGWN